MLHQVQYCHLKQDHILEGAAVLHPKHKITAENVHKMCKNILIMVNSKLARNAGAEDTWVNTTGESDDKGRS